MTTYHEEHKLAIVGNDEGDTRVVLCDGMNEDFIRFLHHLSVHPDSPVFFTDRVWIPSRQELEDGMLLTYNRVPNERQSRFLAELEYFVRDLYTPGFHVCPGQATTLSVGETEAVVGREVVALFRHTRQEPADPLIRGEMFSFAVDYLSSLY